MAKEQGNKEETPVAESKETTAITNQAPGMTQPPVVLANQAYITKVLTDFKEKFEAANAGLDMDFVRLGQWLCVSKKGNYVERNNKGTPDEVNYGENLDVIIATGEKLWSLWGIKDSDLDSVLIVGAREKEEAIVAFREWIAANPQYVNDYHEEDIELRYRALVVPIDSINADDFPTVYLMSFSPTATISFGQWARDIFIKGDKQAGIPKGTGVNNIVTRLGTKEMASGKNEWCGITFQALGMFNPAEYGLKVE